MFSLGFYREMERHVRISDMNWMQVEAYLRRDDRAVLPLAVPNSTVTCG